MESDYWDVSHHLKVAPGLFNKKNILPKKGMLIIFMKTSMIKVNFNKLFTKIFFFWPTKVYDKYLPNT